MEDFMKTVKAQLYERAASPLLFSFCVSLVFWNLRLILIVVSSLDPEKKLDYIDNILYPTHWAWVIKCFLGPLVTSLLYIYIYPIPAKYVFMHTKKQQRALKQLQQEIDGETLLSKEESRKILAELRKASHEYESSIADRDAEIAKMKASNDQLIVENLDLKVGQAEWEKQKNNVTETEVESPVLQPETAVEPETAVHLTPTEEELLRKIASAGEGVRESNLISAPGLARIQDQFSLDKLTERGFVKKSRSGYGSIYKATTTGREAVLSLPR